MRTLKKVTGMEMSGSTAHRHDSNKAFMLVAVRLTFVLRTRTLTSSRGFLHSVVMHVLFAKRHATTRGIFSEQPLGCGILNWELLLFSAISSGSCGIVTTRRVETDYAQLYSL
jgi:hypothetical protein